MAPIIYASGAQAVAIIAWNGMDLTDFTGPLEALSHVRNEARESFFKVCTAAETDLSSTSQGVRIARDITTDELIQNIAEYDILIIPGGGAFTANNIPKNDGLTKALDAFIALPPRTGKPRTLISICAGVFYLALTGVLAGKIATCHYLNLKDLKEVCAKHGGTNIVRQHYVDVGNVNGLDVIVSGGITSGFDTILYMVEKMHGVNVAERARAIMDATYRKEQLPHGFV